MHVLIMDPTSIQLVSLVSYLNFKFVVDFKNQFRRTMMIVSNNLTMRPEISARQHI